MSKDNGLCPALLLSKTAALKDTFHEMIIFHLNLVCTHARILDAQFFAIYHVQDIAVYRLATSAAQLMGIQSSVHSHRSLSLLGCHEKYYFYLNKRLL
jgi:hypothetical protein